MKRSFFKLSGLLLIIAFSLSYISNTFAAPAGFSSEIFMSSLNEPISITFAPDNRMFIVTRLGTIHVAQPGSNQIDPTPFLQLPNIDVTDAENGSYSLIFDPNFSSNNYFYVFYTSNINGVIRDRVSRFTANGNTTDPNTELVLWQDLDPPGSTHHGGSLAFDSSGYLYIGVGEHFFPNLSQDTNSYRGKILRIRTDGTAPSDNPFYIGDGQPHDFVWAWGIRQPFKLHYDQPTGRLFLGEVGGNVQTTAIEEVNLITKGANYGWPTCEGTCGVAGMTNPIFSYPHGGINAAVVGGFVYRGTQFPSSYVGDFFYGDYVRAWIQNLNFDSNGNVTGSGNFEPEGGGSIPGISIVDVKQGPEGALYYVDYNYNFQGTIRRIKYNLANQAPVVVSSASSSSSTTVPFTVDFSSFGTFDPEGQPLTYAWNFGDGNNSTQANPSHTYNQKGHYSVVVSVSDGTNTILGDPIEINVGNPPTPVISSPTTNSTFIAGETINFSGSASDVEDGSLADSTLTWIVRFGHDNHTHPGFGPYNSVSQGSFQIPTSGHSFNGSTYYEIILTATDSDGLTGTTSVQINPTKVDLIINTVPSALTIDIDGIPLATPLTYDTLVGFQHTINAPNQTIGSSDYTFNSWDNGGTQSQLVTVPASNLSLTATYDVTQNSDPVTVRFYPQPGDGRAAYFGANNSGCGQAQWDIAKNTTTTGFDYTSSPRSNFVSTGCLGANAVNLTRAFLPFDTNSLPDNAVITNATLNLYITGKINSVNDGNDYIAVVQTSQVSTQSLTTSDYANLGNVEGSNNIDITTIPTYAYTTWTLDSTGLGWISKTGNTLLGLREGHDLQNVWGNYGGAQGNGVAAATSEQAGTIQDPYLDVTYYTPISSGTPTPTPTTPTSTPTPTPTATPTPTPTPTPTAAATPTPTPTPGGTPTTVTFYPQSGDGRVAYFGPSGSGCGLAQWNTAYNSTGSDAWADYTTSPRSNFVSTGCFGNNATSLSRAFLPFDTSSLPDNATITGVKLYLYVTGKANSVDDGKDYISVIQTTQSNTSLLVNTDYTQIGNQEGSNRVDITSMQLSTYTTWTLDSAGLGWISKTSNTLLGLREGHDLQNVWGNYGGGQGNSIKVVTSEQTGTTQDPYLEVTYTLN